MFVLLLGLVGPLEENPYGEAVEPEKAPEAISKAVASLPPEHMFELMKQMKVIFLTIDDPLTNTKLAKSLIHFIF